MNHHRSHLSVSRQHVARRRRPHALMMPPLARDHTSDKTTIRKPPFHPYQHKHITSLLLCRTNDDLPGKGRD